MENLPGLCAVVETPSSEGEPPWPWPTSRRAPCSFLPLSGYMPPEDIGLVIGYLFSYNNICGDTVDSIERSLADSGPLYLPGGLRIRSADREILPACCCGLEGWREWWRFLDGGPSPWLGHDPFAWAELADGNVRVWSDGSQKPAPDAYCVEFKRSHFEIELFRVEQDLRAFARRLEHWAKTAGFGEPTTVRQRFEESFHLAP